MLSEQKYLVESVFGDTEESTKLREITAHLGAAEKALVNFTFQFEFKTLEP